MGDRGRGATRRATTRATGSRVCSTMALRALESPLLSRVRARLAPRATRPRCGAGTTTSSRIARDRRAARTRTARWAARSRSCSRRCGVEVPPERTMPCHAAAFAWPRRARAVGRLERRVRGLRFGVARDPGAAAVKLVPLGQMAGQRMLLALGDRDRGGRRASGSRARDDEIGSARRASHSRARGTKRSTRGSFGPESSPMSDIMSKDILRVGVGGPVGSGKTALIDALCKRLRDHYDIAVVTNDIYTQEDAQFLMRARRSPAERIMGVETGGCPHTAIREDASINLEAVDRMHRAISRPRHRLRRERRRQPGCDVQPRAVGPHALRDRRRRRRQDPAQGRARHHAVRPARSSTRSTSRRRWARRST